MDQIDGSFFISQKIKCNIEDLFFLITDVVNYPKIFYFIKKINVSKESDNIMCCDVHVGKSLFSLSYSCSIQTFPFSTILISSNNGVFKSMEACWLFKKCNDSDYYDISYSMKFLCANHFTRIMLNNSIKKHSAETVSLLLNYYHKKYKSEN